MCCKLLDPLQVLAKDDYLPGLYYGKHPRPAFPQHIYKTNDRINTSTVSSVAKTVIFSNADVSFCYDSHNVLNGGRLSF